jgi:hypothetical protein
MSLSTIFSYIYHGGHFIGGGNPKKINNAAKN